MESANNIDLPNVFVVRVENKIPIEKKLTIIVSACYAVRFYKNNTTPSKKSFGRRGEGSSAPVLGPPLN